MKNLSKPKAYPAGLSCVTVNGKAQFFNGPIFLVNFRSDHKKLKGQIAQMGRAQGRAKIVTKVSQLSKVQKGDILITYMTNPNFFPAMIKAAAFVTDEGGLTCHAAIVAREMKKPCVIGTQILKDGDLCK